MFRNSTSHICLFLHHMCSFLGLPCGKFWGASWVGGPAQPLVAPYAAKKREAALEKARRPLRTCLLSCEYTPTNLQPNAQASHVKLQPNRCLARSILAGCRHLTVDTPCLGTAHSNALNGWERQPGVCCTSTNGVRKEQVKHGSSCCLFFEFLS